MKIDSELTFEQATAQNPDNPWPSEITESLGLLDVVHIGLDKQLHIGQIVVARSVISEVKAFFDLALDIDFRIEQVIPAVKFGWDDESLMANNVSSGFNFRKITSGRQLSKHALGLAFDINPRQNPYVRYTALGPIIQPPGAEVWTDEPGTLHPENPLVTLMVGLGWEWGGNWTQESGRTDYQHFEKTD